MKLLCKVSEKTTPSERFHLAEKRRSHIAALAGSSLTAGGGVFAVKVFSEPLTPPRHRDFGTP